MNIIMGANLKDYFSDITDAGLVEFYTNGVIDYVEGTTDAIIDHVGFIPAVEYYQSLQKNKFDTPVYCHLDFSIDTF